MIMKQIAYDKLKHLYPLSKIEIKQRFLGGMSNYTYLALVDDKQVVIRVVDDILNVFVNREHELDHLNILFNANFTSELIYFNLEEGTKISNYIEGHSLVSGLTEEDIKETAKTLKKLHQMKLSGHPYGFLERIKKYQDLLDETIINPLYFKLLKWWTDQYINNFSKDEVTLVHGDAQRSNLLRLDNGEIQLLDFEFTGTADPYYDIASFGNISFDDSIKLLGYYLSHDVTRLDEVKVMYYRMFQVLQWYLVATFKEIHGYSEKLKIDFNHYATHYLNFANELYLKIKDDLNGN